MLWLLELCNTACVTRVQQNLYTCQEQCVPCCLGRCHPMISLRPSLHGCARVNAAGEYATNAGSVPCGEIWLHSGLYEVCILQM